MTEVCPRTSAARFRTPLCRPCIAASTPYCCQIVVGATVSMDTAASHTLQPSCNQSTKRPCVQLQLTDERQQRVYCEALGDPTGDSPGLITVTQQDCFPEGYFDAVPAASVLLGGYPMAMRAGSTDYLVMQQVRCADVLFIYDRLDERIVIGTVFRGSFATCWPSLLHNMIWRFWDALTVLACRVFWLQLHFTVTVETERNRMFWAQVTAVQHTWKFCAVLLRGALLVHKPSRTLPAQRSARDGGGCWRQHRPRLDPLCADHQL